MMLPSFVSEFRARARHHMPDSLRGFSRDENGGMIVFTLFILICMMLAIGMAIDTVRTEFARIRLQNTTDAAILAAADLEQSMDPRAVVEDYFRRAGIDPDLVNINIEKGLDVRQVSATMKVGVPTMFMDMVGISELAAPASGTAKESVTELEIALVLDNSGSMGQNSDLRLKLLKPAAKNFVDMVLNNEANKGKVSISLVPFATQVTAGEDLLKHYSASAEHGYSHCVTFGTADFATAAMPTTQALSRTGHFDPSQRRNPMRESDQVCSTYPSRAITPWTDNVDLLNTRIDAMVGEGWTSIEIGTKWGAALLDPSARPALTAMIAEGKVDEKFAGQPFAYKSTDASVNRKKYMIVMSDGENTNQWDIKDPYRSGPSPVFGYKNTSGIWVLSYFNAARTGSNKYYQVRNAAWAVEPQGGSSAKQLSWPELWNAVSVKYFTESVYAPATGNNANTLFNTIVGSVATGVKNSRTSQVCKAAKDAGVIVYTIGMDTYGQGDATLLDCASDSSMFYDIDSSTTDAEKSEIYQAFASIARSINQLRLTN